MSTKLVHVAVAVIERESDSREIFVAKRPDHVHQGGLWEFPGGKVEQGESVLRALQRELKEELAIELDLEDPQSMPEPLIKIRHDYGDKCVLLDVWRVRHFDGEPRGAEGQAVQWVAVEALSNLAFPAANKPIVQACCLPDRLIITPSFESQTQLVDYLASLDCRQPALLMLRQPQLSCSDYAQWAQMLSELLSTNPQYALLKLVLHGESGMTLGQGDQSIHLTSALAASLTRRPEGFELVGMSCHSEEELQHAQTLGVDYVTLSPVLDTSSHPNARTLGWTTFESLSENCPLPVFALGGLSLTDLNQAKLNGAQGIAGISAWR